MDKQFRFPFMEGSFRYRFKKVYVCDFEYATIGGELIPTSLAIKNINDPEAEVEFIWLRNHDGTIARSIQQPYEHDANNLMVVFLGEAECSVFHELDWWQPERIVDLYVECRNLNNGTLDGKGVFGLAAMAKHYGCETNYLEDDKTNLRERLGKNQVGEDEIETVKRYNIEDVLVTERLFNKIEKLYDKNYSGGIVWEQALDRGQHVAIAAEAGRTGYPIDVEAWDKFINKFDDIMAEVITNAHSITNCFIILKIISFTN